MQRNIANKDLEEEISKSDLDSTDTPAESDELSISEHIEGLAKFLIKCDTPTTISIQGEWGTGKTSIMQLVMNEILGDEILHIWFNTWQFSQFSLDHHLPSILLNRLIKQISENGDFHGKSKSKKRKLNKTLRSIETMKNTMGIAASDVIQYKTGLSIKKLIGKDNVYKQIDNLKADFKDWVDDVNQERIIIYIDDLDRLVPQKAVELLETLKIFLDVEKCVFVLAIDRDVVIRGVADKYGFDINNPKELEKGLNFFDKIIQVPYRVPVDEYDIKDLIKKTLSNEEYNEDFRLQNIENLLIHSVGKNPRSIKRILNTFKLQSIIKKDFNEDQLLILFGLICMEQAYPAYYSYFVDKFQDKFYEYRETNHIENKHISQNIVEEIVEESEMDDNSSVLLEELNLKDNEKFLKLFLVIVKGIEIKKLAEIINASMNTSNKLKEKIDIKSKWKVFDDLDGLLENHWDKNNIGRKDMEIMDRQARDILNNIRSLFHDLKEELNEEYKSNPDDIRSTISLKRGKTTLITDIQLQKKSISVELPFGKTLIDNEKLQNILKDNSLTLPVKDRLTLNVNTFRLLESDKMAEFLKMVRIIIENKR